MRNSTKVLFLVHQFTKHILISEKKTSNLFDQIIPLHRSELYVDSAVSSIYVVFLHSQLCFPLSSANLIVSFVKYWKQASRIWKHIKNYFLLIVLWSIITIVWSYPSDDISDMRTRKKHYVIDICAILLSGKRITSKIP